MKKIILFLTIFFISAFPLYSDITINGSGNYSSISSALTNAGPGDIIEITDSGEYYDTINISQSDITIRGAAGQRPTIYDTSGSQFINIYMSNITIENLRLIVTDTQAFNVIYISSGSDNNTIKNCEIIGPGSTNNCIGIYIENNNHKIINCRISGCNTGINLESTGMTYPTYIFYNTINMCNTGINLSPEGNQYIYNNTIVQNETGIQSAGPSMLPGVTFNVKNNIIYNNSVYDLYFTSPMYSYYCNLENNCFSFSKIQNNDPSMTIINSNSGYENKNIDQDPLFVDSGNNDFSLSSGSPCIDAGQNITEWFSYNPPSIISYNRDIGAYEYDPPEESSEEPPEESPIFTKPVYVKQKYVKLSANRLSPGDTTSITLTELNKFSGDNGNIYVIASIYDLSGRLIKNLYDGDIPSSQDKELIWDGKDAENNYVGSGVFILRVQLGTIVKTKKIFFIQ